MRRALLIASLAALFLLAGTLFLLRPGRSAAEPAKADPER